MLTKLNLFNRFLASFYEDTDVLENLTQFKIAVTALNTSQIQYVASNIDLQVLFNCLNSTDKRQVQGDLRLSSMQMEDILNYTALREQIELSCDILNTLLSTLEPSEILKKYEDSLVRALKHPNCAVKEIALQQLQRDVLFVGHGTMRDVLENTIVCSTDTNTNVSKEAISLMVKLGQSEAGLGMLYAPSSVRAFNAVMETSDTNRFRVFEVVIKVSLTSEQGLRASHRAGMLEPLLILACSEEDILLRLTALEMLSDLGEAKHGLAYLEENQFLKKLIGQLDEWLTTLEKSCAFLLLPGLLKFFGRVTRCHPEYIAKKHKSLLDVLFKAATVEDIAVAAVAIETIGYIATSPQGKITLNNTEDQQKCACNMPVIMRRLYEIISSSLQEWRGRAMEALANIVDLVEEEQNSELLAMTEAWFKYLAPDAMTYIASLSRQPFPETKFAAMKVLLALAGQPWGQTLIVNSPGLLEYLMDRFSEVDNEGKQAKYQVICRMANSSHARATLGSPLHLRLRQHLHEGPTYVPIETQVAIEGAS